MKNVLLITDTAPQDKSGGGTNGNMHCRMINAIENLNVYSIYITNQSIECTDHTARITGSSKIEKAGAIACGYTPYLNKRARKYILEVIKEKDISIVYIDNSISGKLIKDIKNSFFSIKVIAFFHDIEIIKMREERNASLLRRLVLPTFYRNEADTVFYADKTIVLNERDRKLYEQEYKKEPDAMVPISIPEIENLQFDIKHIEDKRLKILFVGVEYGPNLSGVRWFLKEVLPYITCDFEFDIVGYNMEKYRTEFEAYSNRVQVIGTVESLRDWYVKTDLVVAPIFEGGGMKVKTAEALSYGKHFVGCTESLEGYWEDMPQSLRNQKVFKCDDAKEFANIVNKMASQEFYIVDEEIKEWADSKYSYQANLARYKEIFNAVM